MYIRSQCEAMLINVEDFRGRERTSDGPYDICGINQIATVVLGRYTTKDKANKVLSMLEEAIVWEAYARNIIIHQSLLTADWREMFGDDLVFHMPADEDVEV